MNVDLDLLREYNQSLPRYTSYPTAPHFTEAVGRETFQAEVLRSNASSPMAPLSLYLHLPFCRQLCYYCGCHMKVTHDPERIAKYLRYLKREVDLMAPLLSPERPVTQIHWGGGTPTLLPPDQIRELGGHLRDRFRVAPDAEISIEADPRGLTEDHVAAAREIGVNRLSLGVQSFDPTVQEAINRVQPERLTRTAVRWARDHGISGIHQLSGLYAQNTKNLRTYYDQIDQDELTVCRGYRPTQEDRLRRHVIMQFMCNAEVRKAAVEARFNVDFDMHFSEALDRLRPMERDGLAILGPDALTVRPPGRLLVRNVASAFDAYLHDASPDEQPAYSESV